MTVAFFAIALLFGLRHPPFLARVDFVWPPFQSIHERLLHAFALSLWVLYFGLPTLAVLGIFRRISFSFHPNTLEKLPVHPDRNDLSR